MDQSDKLLWPCFLASLVVNTIGIMAVANSSILDPKRQIVMPKSEERHEALLYHRPTPKPPPTPRPVQPTPTPPPTPTPAPRCYRFPPDR